IDLLVRDRKPRSNEAALPTVGPVAGHLSFEPEGFARHDHLHRSQPQGRPSTRLVLLDECVQSLARDDQVLGLVPWAVKFLVEQVRVPPTVHLTGGDDAFPRREPIGRLTAPLYPLTSG